MVTGNEKINLLNDRLKCLAAIEWETFGSLDKRIYKNIDNYTIKYINEFIGKVMKNTEIVSILDKNVK